MKSFTALITPFDMGAHPDHELPTPQPPTGGGQPPHPDNTLPGDIPRPEHPIWYPLPPGVLPPQIDNTLPGEQPHPDQGLPGSQPRPDQGLPGPQPHPEHPIVLPPGGGGGWLPVYIDNTLPGDQPYPDQGLPGQQPRPDQGLPGPQPRPEHPIVLPPEGENPPGEIKWVAGWTPATGWVTVGIVVPEGPIPTPSRQGQQQSNKAKRK
jgi:hypothetical protein